MTHETDRTKQAVTLRPIEELNLIEDFLTNQMIIHPVVGLRFSKRVLAMILGREIGTLSIAAQKAYSGENTDRHGIRLDVCLDEQGGDIVDLEPDQNSSAENAVTPELRELHEMVTRVKCDKEVGLAYMKAYEIEQRLLRQGSMRGEEKNLLQKIITKVKKGENVPEIARELEEDEKSIRRRVEIVNRHAPAYDLEAILDEVMCAKKAGE